MIFHFHLPLDKSNLLRVCSVSFGSPSFFIHYPIVNHFSPALYIIFITSHNISDDFQLVYIFFSIISSASAVLFYTQKPFFNQSK